MYCIPIVVTEDLLFCNNSHFCLIKFDVCFSWTIRLVKLRKHKGVFSLHHARGQLLCLTIPGLELFPRWGNILYSLNTVSCFTSLNFHLLVVINDRYSLSLSQKFLCLLYILCEIVGLLARISKCVCLIIIFIFTKGGIHDYHSLSV